MSETPESLRALLSNQAGRFLIGKWLREACLYFLFLVAFTYTQLMGKCIFVCFVYFSVCDAQK